ncbi:hypothetical protein KBB96_09760 [Luteolibacter ambystomatis]|uniref:Uncharacterized protein n=1 Tax=Luteolibacter ambystomatis TaxID=2824561 RepID=A0A975J3A9_9BACT|nr:hypothetical protein [Luteolibacter ambystomatis]QUE53166.1 hypothetical protein KBB96_09760 [Luteolibacter ambystomatis]
MSAPLSPPGSLRVGPAAPAPVRPADPGLEAVEPPANGAPPQAPATAPDKPYLARLVLLVPAEVISLYVALKPTAVNFLPQFGIVCLLLVILVRWKATKGTDGKAEWGSVVISAISFGLWIYSVGGSLPWLPAPKDAGVIAVAIGVWTFTVPYFYQGAKPASA